jgi:hypothetical protein
MIQIFKRQGAMEKNNRILECSCEIIQFVISKLLKEIQ